MNTQQMGKPARMLLFISSILLPFVVYLPIWKIELDAPQYPEGLSLQIHANDIRGNVDIINGLNHYIGMKTMHKEDFIEFSILPYIIIGFSILFFIGAWINRKKLLYTLFSAFVLFGIIAMVDFWKWEYDYGHDLDPNAAIQVPGMAYQPPLIGFKQLLNFGAYSMPDLGGWIFIVIGLMLLTGVILELRFSKSPKSVLFFLPLLFLFQACTIEVKPIQVGRDNCHFCKMGISDIRFAAAILTKQGKTLPFDDLKCLLNYLQINKETAVQDIYVSNFSGKHELVLATQAYYISSPSLGSPMTGNMAAFNDKNELVKNNQALAGEEKTWESIRQ
ncbi:hypothetical protein HME7025_01810 [Aquirufa nivalisilvae]|uniref:Uncharacterized protein n=1 Tax=Aquirufa nivalisilvae TaxID=2516557 RepID=A0A2S2DWJ6_9BACT|nr:nitrous oxide reductase accessory protein NosL [Aquirufa nivalisilvae]AWL09662.1 hypothetical protein HME7025_01810 [Aquirufa nivalisilvae]